MQKWKSSILFALLAAVCLPQSATQLVTPEIRRVGDRLACRCGVCNNTVATCQMLECNYSYPARQKIAALQKEGKSDDTIVAGFVQESGISALSAPPTTGFSLVGWLMPFGMIGIGLIGIFFYMKRFRLRPASAAPTEIDAETYAKYRDSIDKEVSKLE